MTAPRPGELVCVVAISGTEDCENRPPASVVGPLAAVLRQKHSLVAELLDVRLMLEPPLAARAATHASEREIAEMEEILRRQEQKVTRGQASIDEDSEFHHATPLVERWIGRAGSTRPSPDEP